MKYQIPNKEIDRIIEIEGFPPYELSKVSFAEKMDFLNWLDKMKNENPTMILETVIKDNLPSNLAEAILNTENMVFISEIYAQIVSCKLGMSVEDYLKESDKALKKQ